MIRRINRLIIARRYGWTLEYVDTLDPFDVADILGEIEGMAKLENRP